MTAERTHGMREPARTLLVWCALAASLLVASCGNLTAGGATGETTVLVSGDAPDPASASVTESAASSPARASDSDDEPEGELELSFSVSLVTLEGRSLPLTEDEAEIEVEFPGEQEREVVTRTVPAGRYSGLRLAFTEIEAEADSGLVVEGDTITEPVDVEFEGDSLVVERPLDLEVAEGSRAELVVDMNTQSWLSEVDPELLVVAGDLVADVIEIFLR